MYRTLLIAFLVWLLPAATIAHADDLAAARKAIEAQYARLDAAMNRRDPSPPEGVAAPDFRYLSVNGDEFDLGQWKILWRHAGVLFETLTVRAEVQSVALEGDTARVVVRAVSEGKGKQGGLIGKLRSEETVHDTWERLGQTWRLRRSAVIRSKVWDNDVLAEEATARPPLDPARREVIVGELRARAIPFNTDKPGTGFDDLAALDQIIGDARIVALGESTHGTAEFFRMKHRLFEYLVEKKGFTVFAFEANWPEVEIADRYVKTGEGTAAAALKAMHGVWQTEEVRDLIEWMRAYNSAPGRQKLLSFTGFDMQDSAAPAWCVIHAFNKLDAGEAKTVQDYYTVSPGTDAATVRARFADALKLVEARRAALLQHLTAAEYARVHRCATVVIQASQIDINAGMVEYSNIRDKAMAENVKWLAEEAFPGEKIALWAHNGHIAAAQEGKGPVPMGWHLRQMFGEQMRVLGFAFDRGEVHHIPFGPSGPDPSKAIAVKVPPASPMSAEAVLRAAGLPRFILDLRTVPAAGPLGAWIAEPQRLRTMGWGGEPHDDPASAYPMVATYGTLVLPKAFDALVYIEESSATVPLK